MTTWPIFEQAHIELHAKLKDYLRTRRVGAKALSDDVRAEIPTLAAKHLMANNMQARIDYLDVASTMIVDQLARLPPGKRVSWVTLIAEQFVTTLPDAATFDPKTLQTWAAEQLKGCNFIGMVEASLYTNVGLIREGMKQAVSWHVHALVWGPAQDDVKALVKRINGANRTLIPGLDAARAASFNATEVEGKVIYMLKAPQSEYRIWAHREEAIDTETGEISKFTTGKFYQGKRPLLNRPGLQAKMCNAMWGLRLDDLSFAAGEGVKLLSRINYRALAKSRAWTAAHEKRRQE
ncbi:hypothetical protein [Methylobacterium sp. 88A]|uniref:hypothetical protein n=1 Tax=Methylobacterium sp. 88A TaxID=1131813 RepID=UPI0003773147|nr:hypothetical protein [Methylobacterium sp. 88A]